MPLHSTVLNLNLPLHTSVTL